MNDFYDDENLMAFTNEIKEGGNFSLEMKEIFKENEHFTSHGSRKHLRWNFNSIVRYIIHFSIFSFNKFYFKGKKEWRL